MRVVLDTGVVVSALLFAKGRLGWLRERWTARSVLPLVSPATTSELIRVLAYPKFELTREEVEAVLSAYLPFCEAVTGKRPRGPRLPRSSDPADQKFLALAGAGKADALITSDRHLLDLRSRTPFAILSPSELKQAVGSRSAWLS